MKTLKKTSALTMAAILGLTMGGMAASADTISSLDETATANVTGTYVSGAQTTVYSVDIEWGDMSFTYHADGKIWDPSAHQYIDDESALSGWVKSDAEGAACLKITNHSNVGVRTKIVYVPSGDFSDIKGAFSYTNYDIPTVILPDGSADSVFPSAASGEALGNPEKAASNTYELSLRETPKSFEAGSALGTITVTIEEYNE